MEIPVIDKLKIGFPKGVELIVGHKFKILYHLANGYRSKIYLAVNEMTGEVSLWETKTNFLKII